jgi:outer membrane protein TolC
MMTGRMANKERVQVNSALHPSRICKSPASALLALWFVLLLVAAETGMAQSPEKTLTLNEAVEVALKQNLDVQIATLDLARHQQERVIARAKLLPQAGFDGSESVTRYNKKALIGMSGSPYSIGPYQSVSVGPSFSTPIFDLTLLHQYQASGHQLQASREDQQTVREETVLLVVSEYMAHLKALAAIDAAESRVKLATRLAKQASDLRNDGVATKIDVSRAEVRLREEKQRLIDAQRDAETSMYALKRILNLPESQPVAFADREAFSVAPALELSDPVTVALEQRPELKSMTQNVLAAKDQHAAAVADSLPKLKFTGKWNEQGGTLSTITPGYEYRFDLSLPIFTAGRIKAERKNSALTEQQTERQLQQARNQVTEEVRDGEVEIQAARNQVELGQQEVQLANDEVTLSQGRFQSGVTDNIEVIAAQDSLARANDEEINALYRYNIARAQLARAVGRIGQIYKRP